MEDYASKLNLAVALKHRVDLTLVQGFMPAQEQRREVAARAVPPQMNRNNSTRWCCLGCERSTQIKSQPCSRGRGEITKRSRRVHHALTSAPASPSHALTSAPASPSHALTSAQKRQIIVDLPRTNPNIELFQDERVQLSLHRLLYIWAIRHPGTGYVQVRRVTADRRARAFAMCFSCIQKLMQKQFCFYTQSQCSSRANRAR
jgi:hypothetical protein